MFYVTNNNTTFPIAATASHLYVCQAHTVAVCQNVTTKPEKKATFVILSQQNSNNLSL